MKKRKAFLFAVSTLFLASWGKPVKAEEFQMTDCSKASGYYYTEEEAIAFMDNGTVYENNSETLAAEKIEKSYHVFSNGKDFIITLDENALYLQEQSEKGITEEGERYYAVYSDFEGTIDNAKYQEGSNFLVDDYYLFGMHYTVAKRQSIGRFLNIESNEIAGSSGTYEEVESDTSEALKERFASVIAQYESVDDYGSIIIYMNENKNYSKDIEEFDQIYDNAVQKYKTDIMEKADAFIVQEKYEAAENILMTASDIVINDSEISNKLKELTKKEIIHTIDSYETSENYEAIITYINTEVEDNNKDEEIHQIYDEAVEKYKTTIIEKAEEYITADDFISAKSILMTTSNVIGEDVEIEEKLNNVKKQEVFANLLSYEIKDDYEGAIAYLEQNKALVNKDTELQTKLNSFIENYRTQVLNDAEQAYETGGYTEAILVLNNALKVLSNDSIIENEKTRYEAAIPVKLIDLDVLKQGAHLYVGECGGYNYLSDIDRDINDNSYSLEETHYIYRYYHEAVDEGERYISYYLNQNYDCLTGIMYLPYVTLSCLDNWNEDGILEIYGDGVLLYQNTLSQDSLDAIEFSVNVSGVRELKIEIGGYWPKEVVKGLYSDTYWFPKICVTKLEVSKEP